MTEELEEKEHNYQTIKSRRVRLKKYDHSGYRGDRLYYWTLMIMFIFRISKKARLNRHSRRILFYTCL